MFKRRRFPVEIILVCVRWYCKYGISYRDLVEMMQERGVEVDPSTIMRWVHRYAPELEKRVRWYQGYRATSWRVDETYVKVGGKWKYLFRAVDKHGRLIDFMLSGRQHTRCLSFSRQSVDNDASLASVLDHRGPTWFLSQSDQPAPAERQAVRLYQASDLQVPEQHHRSGPWSAQASHSTHTRLSDD
nr:IS6 family transposase [Armatimonadota bacterium]